MADKVTNNMIAKKKSAVAKVKKSMVSKVKKRMVRKIYIGKFKVSVGSFSSEVWNEISL